MRLNDILNKTRETYYSLVTRAPGFYPIINSPPGTYKLAITNAAINFAKRIYNPYSNKKN